MSTDGEPDFTGARWYKASKSNPGQGGCVEVAHLRSGHTAMRDSKDRDGGTLVFTPHEWECFLDGAANGEFARPIE